MSILMEYDFDYLRDLYIKDPEEFKRITSNLIEAAIDDTPEHRQESYRCKQWKLEQELGKIKNPTARMNKMVSIFWEGVYDFIEVAKDAGFGAEEPPPPPPPKPSNVIDIKKKT